APALPSLGVSAGESRDAIDRPRAVQDAVGLSRLDFLRARTAGGGSVMETQDTRGRILDAALALFRERGFEETTMRDIAVRAKVATGLAYYYFESKNAIVLAFYQQARHELTPLLEAAHRERTLAARLAALIDIKFKYFAPNRAFLGALLG